MPGAILALVFSLVAQCEKPDVSNRADGFVEAMRDALRAYLGFAGADRLAWAPHLGTEKRLFLTQP